MEMEATGAPQNHHHTLNQQVGSITPTTYWHPFMSKGALYEFNNPDQLKIPLPHKHIASTFNDIMSKDVGYAYVSLLYACPLKTHSLRLNPFSK